METVAQELKQAGIGNIWELDDAEFRQLVVRRRIKQGRKPPPGMPEEITIRPVDISDHAGMLKTLKVGENLRISGMKQKTASALRKAMIRHHHRKFTVACTKDSCTFTRVE